MRLRWLARQGSVLRLVCACALLALCFSAFGATHYPERFAGTDQQKLEKAFAACKDGDTVDLGTKLYTFGKSIAVGKGKPYNCLKFQGSGYWAQLTYTGVGSMFVFWDIKNARVDRVCARRIGGAVEIEPLLPTCGFENRITGSSSWVMMAQARAQGFTRGFWNNADPDADGCHFLLTQCEAYECGTGFAWDGNNNLGPTFLDCAASGVDTGWLMLGGSGFKLIGCGGTKMKVYVKTRGGFLGTVRDSETEDVQLGYLIGGEGLDGFGAEQGLTVEDMEHRNIGKLAEINKAGVTRLSVLSLNWPLTVDLTNKSGKPATFIGSANIKTKTIEGTWQIGGQAGSVGGEKFSLAEVFEIAA